MKMIDDKNIGDVQVEDSQIVFTDKDHKTIYKTGTMEDPGLTERLYNSGATFAKDIEQTMSPLMSDFKRRIATFLCMVMTLTTVFCMMPQQEVQAASNQMKFNWRISILEIMYQHPRQERHMPIMVICQLVDIPVYLLLPSVMQIRCQHAAARCSKLIQLPEKEQQQRSH